MTKHGHAAGGRLTVEYVAWCSMIRRCENPASKGYHRYGGRGIRVCARWRSSFSAFIGDVGMRPARGYSLDRMNNDGNYEPANVRWATLKEQARNRRDVPLIGFRGEYLSAAEWGEVMGVPGTVITGRIRTGWSAERAIAAPYRPHTSMRVEFRGRRLTVAELARLTQVDRKVLMWRIKAGWPMDRVVSSQDFRRCGDGKNPAASGDTETAGKAAVHGPRTAAGESRG